MADYGLFPPINILSSASRLFGDLAQSDHKEAARKFRRLYSLLRENEVLIRIGAYSGGTDPELDQAIRLKDAMERFLKQETTECGVLNESVAALSALFK